MQVLFFEAAEAVEKIDLKSNGQTTKIKEQSPKNPTFQIRDQSQRGRALGWDVGPNSAEGIVEEVARRGRLRRGEGPLEGVEDVGHASRESLASRQQV